MDIIEQFSFFETGKKSINTIKGYSDEFVCNDINKEMVIFRLFI